MPIVQALGKKFKFPDGVTPEQMGQAIDEYFLTLDASQLTPEQSKAIDQIKSRAEPQNSTFDPDAYLARKQQTSAFDPDAYLASRAQFTPEQQAAIQRAQARLDQSQAGPQFTPEQQAAIERAKARLSSEAPVMRPGRPQITGGRGIAGQRAQQQAYDYKEAIKAQIPPYEGDFSQLQEIGASPEFNEPSMQSLKASLAANLMGSDFELAQALQKQIPGTTFTRDDDANLIAKFPSGKDYYLNSPGLSGQDFAKFGTRAAAFAVPGGGQLPALAIKAGLTETALQGGEKALGGEFNKEDIGLSAVAAPVGQVIGQQVVAPALRQVPELIKRAFRGGEAGRQNLAGAIDDFAELDITPSLGQGTGKSYQQGFESISSKILGGGPIRKSIENTSIKMQQRLAQIADDLSPIKGNTEAGRSIQSGITGPGGFVERFQSTSGDLWRKFDSMIDDSLPVQANKTMVTLEDVISNTNVGKVLNNPLLSRIKDALEATNGKIDYKTFRALRSAIGARLGGNDLISDIPKAELKRVYAALSSDLKDIAYTQGKSSIFAFERANKYTAAGHKRLDDFVNRLTKKADLNKVFEAISRGGEGTQSLNAIKRSLQPHEWNTVASNVLRQLGRASNSTQDDIGSVFSVPKFLTDWNRLGPAKKVLFSGSDEINAYSRNLDRIASTANRFKQDMSAMANPSGTGQFMTNVGLVSGAAGSLASGNIGPFGMILLGVSANNGAARLMTNPRFVSWLAKGAETKSWPTHLTRLAFVAQTPQAKEDILELLETMKNWGQGLN